MSGRDFWEGTATELLSMIGSRKVGIPKDATRSSTEAVKPHITDALKTYGLTVQRKRTPHKRLLQVKSITQ